MPNDYLATGNLTRHHLAVLEKICTSREPYMPWASERDLANYLYESGYADYVTDNTLTATARGERMILAGARTRGDDA